MDRSTFDLSIARDMSEIPARAHHDRAVRNALAAIWRRRMLVLTIFLVVFALGVTALIAMPRKYAAEAILQLDVGSQQHLPDSASAPGAVVEGSAIVQSEASVIHSRMIARRVVDRLHLADEVRFAVHPSRLGLLWRRVTGVPRADLPGRLEKAEDWVLNGMTVQNDSRSYLITVHYVSSQPDVSAKIANAVADSYVQWREQSNYELANKTFGWLTTQVAQARENLRQAQDRLITFRAQNGLIDTVRGGHDVEQQLLDGLIEQVSAASLARTNAQAQLARVQAIAASGATPSAADLQGSPVIQRLLEQQAASREALREKAVRLGPHHPAIRQAQAELNELNAAIAAEVRNSVSLIEGEVVSAQTMENDLRGRVRALQQQIVNGAGKQTEIGNLETSEEAASARLSALLHTQEQTLAIRDLPPVAASVVAPAEPVSIPSSPKPVVVLAISLIGGLGAATAVAVLLEQGDRGVHSSADVRLWTNRRCLGMVPEIAQSPRGAADAAIFDETVRGVGASLNLFGPPRECQVVLVTSSVEQEGKSVLCHALARVLTESGKRVMLVDGTPPEEIDALAGKSLVTLPPNQTGRKLALLHRSTRASLALNVFGSSRFGQCLSEARKHFDVILFEGPPVMLMADSLVLGRPADAVIHVVRWASTKQRVVEAALERLRENSVVVDGLVLARVDLHRHAAYRFVDQCSQYIKDRRIFERLSRQRQEPREDETWAA